MQLAVVAAVLLLGAAVLLLLLLLLLPVVGGAVGLLLGQQRKGGGGGGGASPAANAQSCQRLSWRLPFAGVRVQPAAQRHIGQSADRPPNTKLSVSHSLAAVGRLLQRPLAAPLITGRRSEPSGSARGRGGAAGAGGRRKAEVGAERAGQAVYARKQRLPMCQQWTDGALCRQSSRNGGVLCVLLRSLDSVAACSAHYPLLGHRQAAASKSRGRMQA